MREREIKSEKKFCIGRRANEKRPFDQSFSTSILEPFDFINSYVPM